MPKQPSNIELLLSLLERELTLPFSFPANSIKQRKPKLLLPPAQRGSSSTMTVLKGETLLLECFAEGLWVPWPLPSPLPYSVSNTAKSRCLLHACSSVTIFKNINTLPVSLKKQIGASLYGLQATTEYDLEVPAVYCGMQGWSKTKLKMCYCCL